MTTGIVVRQIVAHEVRVTMRGVRLTEDGAPVQVSTRSDFIAPELSAPSTLDIELDKGLRGWSDYDVVVPDKRPLHIQRAEAARKAQAEADLAAITAGESVIRKAPEAPKYRLNASNGAAHRAARQAAKRARYSK